MNFKFVSKVTWGVLVWGMFAGCPGAGPVGALEDGGTDAGVPDAGVIACGDVRSTPQMACGTLSWSASPTASRPRNHHFTFISETPAGAYLFALGGAEDGLIMSNADSAPLSADGQVGAWKRTTGLPIKMAGMTGGVVSHLLLLAGGTVKDSGEVSDQAYSAFVLDDGSLGAWSNAGSTLHRRMHPAGFTRGNQFYVLGGFDAPNVWDDVVRATVNDDGSVSAWEPAGKLPGPRTHLSVAYVDGYVFITGGANSAFASDPPLDEVKRAKLDDDGKISEWVDMPNLPVKVVTHSSFFYGGYLYVAAGINAAMEHEKRVWRAPMGADHSLGAWDAVADLPLPRGHVHQVPIFKTHVYMVSGAVDFMLNSTPQIAVGTFR